MAAVAEQETYERFWEEAISLLSEPTRLLILRMHPTQLLILEALGRLGTPVSATVMQKVSGGQVSTGRFTYHLQSLMELGLLEVVETKPRRGAREKFYDLTRVKADSADDDSA